MAVILGGFWVATDYPSGLDQVALAQQPLTPMTPGGAAQQFGAPAGSPSPSPSPEAAPAAVPPTATSTPVADYCVGDEQLTYVPEEPRIGAELLIAASSSRPHPYPRLAGTERTAQQGQMRPGQLGYVWEWTIQPSYPGHQEYTFYVDSTIPCTKITIDVRNALATSTPKPTKTPTPYGFNANDNNGNDNQAPTSTPTVPPAVQAPATPTPTPVSAPAPSVDQVSGPFVGIRTDGRNDSTTIADTGATWAAVGISWADTETQNNVYNWAPLDAALVTASNNGQRPVLTGTGVTPSWVGSTSCQITTAQQQALFAEFMAAMVTRYSGRNGAIPDGQYAGQKTNIKYWGLYNEVNNTLPSVGSNYGGCFGTLDGSGRPTTAGPTTYAQLIATVGPAIHAADPDAKVVYAGLPSAQFINTPPFCPATATDSCPFDRAFFTVSLQALKQLGALNQLDVTMLNYYSSHQINWGWEAYGTDLVGRIRGFRQEMRNAGLSDSELKPIIVQESSYTDPYVVNGAAQVPESTDSATYPYNVGQRDYVPQVLSRAASLDVLAIFWFKLQDTSGGSGGDWPYGLKTTSGSAKPGYSAFRYFNRLIDRQDRFVRTLTFSQGRLEGYEFLTADGRRVQIVWRNKDPKAVSDPDTPETYTPGFTIAGVTDSVGSSVSTDGRSVAVGFAPRFIFDR